jgi:ferredoxin
MEMAYVTFKDDNIRVKVPAGTPMRQVASKCGTSIPFGCRVGDCATCIVHVESGMLYLSEKSEKELKVLGMLGGDVSELRLICQCQVRCDRGEIVVSQGV